MLALAVVKKAANMSSIADSWERKEGDKFECHFKPVVIQTVLTFCRFCPCVEGLALPLLSKNLHPPWVGRDQTKTSLFFHFCTNWTCARQVTDAETQLS